MALLATPLIQQGVAMTNKPRKDDQRPLAEMEKVLSERATTAMEDRVKLRDAVCAYHAAEKARGTSLSTITARLTAALNKSEEGTLEATAKLVGDLLDWCTRYYLIRPVLEN